VRGALVRGGVARGGVLRGARGAPTAALALTRHRERPGEVAAGAAQSGGVLELAGGVGEAQSQQILAQRGDLLGELAAAQVAQLLDVHRALP